MDTPAEWQRKIKNRNNLITQMHDSFICNTHEKRIFNCSVNSSYIIYYESCCEKFSDLIKKELSNYPLTSE